jgi:hypothetical protein
MNLKKNIIFICMMVFLVVNITSVIAVDTVWVVVADEQVENKEDKCIGSYSMIEDYPGLYDFYEDGTDEEVMISKYIVLADEVMAFVDCNYMTEFQSIPFTTDKEYLYLDLRYRDTSGLWFMVGVDGGNYQTVNDPWENENCIQKSQNIVRVDDFLVAQGLNDGAEHVINIKLVDYDGYCPDAAQVWFPTKITESNKEKKVKISTSDGLGVSVATITKEIVGNLNYLFMDPYGGDGEDEDYSREIGRMYGYSNAEKEMGQEKFDNYINHVKKNPKDVKAILDNPEGLTDISNIENLNENNKNDKVEKVDDSKSDEKIKKNSEQKASDCEKDEVLREGKCVYRCEFDERWNGRECIPDRDLNPNEYEVDYTSKDEKIIKFVDVYGNEKYTKDGKYYYESYGQAATNNPIRNAWHGTKEAITGFKDFLFKTKFKDEDKKLQTEVAREVLSDFKSQKEKDREKIIGKLESKIAGLASNVVPKPLQDLVSVPGDSIKKFANEAKETEFAEGARIYIKERELGSTANTLYTNTPQELEYGGIGGGVAQGLNSEYPKALLFAKYEEVYQRYKIAKELDRKE